MHKSICSMMVFICDTCSTSRPYGNGVGMGRPSLTNPLIGCIQCDKPTPHTYAETRKMVMSYERDHANRLSNVTFV